MRHKTRTRQNRTLWKFSMKFLRNGTWNFSIKQLYCAFWSCLQLMYWMLSGTYVGIQGEKRKKESRNRRTQQIWQTTNRSFGPLNKETVNNSASVLVSYFGNSYMCVTESFKSSIGWKKLLLIRFAERYWHFCKQALILRWSLDMVCPHFAGIKPMLQAFWGMPVCRTILSKPISVRVKSLEAYVSRQFPQLNFFAFSCSRPSLCHLLSKL